MDIRVNELDLTRAGVISVQRSLPSTDTSWQVDYAIGDVMYRVNGNAYYGRPHGQDADVLLSIQTLFFRAGCPDTNTIEVTAASLLGLSGHARNGQYYARLRESLLRLWGVKWTMVRTRWDDKHSRHQGDTTATSLIAELRLVDQSTGQHRPFEDREISESNPIEITLVPSFAGSIRAGLFQILDGELLSRLGQPQARSLYRVLQAHRVMPDGSLASELTLPLRDWLVACGLENERTDNAKRLLESAHERLKEEGYLHQVGFTGRGKAGHVTYAFSAAPEPEAVEQLMERGVTRPVAEALAADHPERVAPALRVIDQRLSTGWKPRSLAASVVDAVRNPAKWGYAAGKAALPGPKKKKAQDVEDVPVDPRQTVLVLLRLKLNRAPSSGAVAAVEHLTDAALAAVRDALERPKDEALRLVQTLLSTEL